MFRSFHNDYYACIIAACLICGLLERLETAWVCECLSAQSDDTLVSGNLVEAFVGGILQTSTPPGTQYTAR